MEVVFRKCKRLAVDAGRHLRYLTHPQTPMIFANSFPKSGTNLFNQVLSGLALNSVFSLYPHGIILSYENRTGARRSTDSIVSDLSKLLPGEIATGHLHALPEVSAFLIRDRIINFFLYRDPRDVVVSHAYYVTNLAENHVHHQYYRDVLPDMDARIKASILGLVDSASDFPNIRLRFEPYLEWLAKPEVMKIRFEDLIQQPKSVVAAVLEFIDGKGYTFRRDKEQIIAGMLAMIKPSQSRTFRKGIIGDWKNHFTAEHVDLFKQSAGDLLIDLGYEPNHDW